MAKSKRKFRNFLLQPLLQTKMGVYVIALTIIFAIAVAAVYYMQFAKFADFVIKLTDLEDEVQGMLNQSISDIQGYVYGLIVLYVFGIVVISIKTTHTMVGPTVAFKKHLEAIRNGNYLHRTILRKGDAFAEIGDELNQLSEQLHSKNG